uniref:Uncharacterized protein n=1 Tax=viral metagenome TaxID=1070528 RepID=A0A6M3JRV9_9ZZZZ
MRINELREMTEADFEALKKRNLCPVCGADLDAWREMFGEKHLCFDRKERV